MTRVGEGLSHHLYRLFTTVRLSHIRQGLFNKWCIISPALSAETFPSETYPMFFFDRKYSSRSSNWSQLSKDSCPDLMFGANFDWNSPPTKIYISTKFLEISSLEELNCRWISRHQSFWREGRDACKASLATKLHQHLILHEATKPNDLDAVRYIELLKVLINKRHKFC